MSEAVQIGIGWVELFNGLCASHDVVVSCKRVHDEGVEEEALKLLSGRGLVYALGRADGLTLESSPSAISYMNRLSSYIFRAKAWRSRFRLNFLSDSKKAFKVDMAVEPITVRQVSLSRCAA